MNRLLANKLWKQLSEPPIIIGGCGRSGTTLLLSILSAHPLIAAIPEETYLFCPNAYSGKDNQDLAFNLDELYDQYLSKIGIAPANNRWCEKTPKNILFIDEILNFFGEVKIINIVRDGRDVVLSVHPNSKENKYWVSTERWVSDVSAGLEYKNHPGVLTIKYEDLITDFIATVSKICTYLNIDFHSNLKTWDKYSKIRQNAAWFGEVQPIFTSSIGKWKQKKYSKEVAAFMNNKEALSLLEKLDYLI